MESKLWPLDPDLVFMFDAEKGSLQNQVRGKESWNATFTRASVATYFDSSGIMQTAPANMPRFENGFLLLEPAATNKLTYSRKMDEWSAGGTPEITQNAVGIDGAANTAWTFTDNAAGACENASFSCACPDDHDPICFSLFIKKDTTTSRFVSLGVYLTAGTMVYAVLHVNTLTGACALEAGSDTLIYGVDSYGDWWRAWVCLTNNHTGNNLASIIFSPARSTVIGTYAAAAVGSAICDGAQIEFATKYPTSFIATGAAEATRATEAGYPQWSLPYESLSAVVATGTCVSGHIYKIEITAVNNYGVGKIAGDFFVSAGTETNDANNKVREVYTVFGEVLGPELVTNGDFSAAIGVTWLNDTTFPYDTLEIAAGKLHLVTDGGTVTHAGSQDSIALVAGNCYKVTWTQAASSGLGTRFGIVNGLHGTGGIWRYPVTGPGLLGNGTFTVYFTAPATENAVFGFYNIIADGATEFTLDNVSVKQVLNPCAGGPPQGTVVVLTKPLYPSGGASALEGIVSVSGGQTGLVYWNTADVACYDGANSSVATLTPTRGTLYKVASVWGYLTSDVAKLCTGGVAGKSPVAWDATPGAFDGIMTQALPLQLAYGITGPAKIQRVWLFNRVLGGDEVNGLT